MNSSLHGKPAGVPESVARATGAPVLTEEPRVLLLPRVVMGTREDLVSSQEGFCKSQALAALPPQPWGRGGV